MRTILLLGGSGFIGRHVAHALSRAGWEVRIPTRDRERAKEQLILLPTVDLRVADIHDRAQLDELTRGTHAVVNLIGVLHDVRNAFQRSHIDLPQQLVESCRGQGVSRLLHMSALNAAANGPSRYLRSKAEGERIVLEASGMATTVFRPSVVFGAGDQFLNLFARLAGVAPVIPLACPQARFQPVFVEDVARAMAMAVDRPATHGQRYDLCGPTVYSLRELVRYAADQSGAHPLILGLPTWLARIQALVMEHLPGRLITRDNIDSMKLDSVSNAPFPAEFGFAPTPLEAVAPRILGNQSSRARYDQFRARR